MPVAQGWHLWSCRFRHSLLILLQPHGGLRRALGSSVDPKHLKFGQRGKPSPITPVPMSHWPDGAHQHRAGGTRVRRAAGKQ